jgi:hypothetical protein
VSAEALTQSAQEAIRLAEKATPGPMVAKLRDAEKINQHRYQVPMYSGGAKVGVIYGPTMEIAIQNAEAMASAFNLVQSTAFSAAMKGE